MTESNYGKRRLVRTDTAMVQIIQSSRSMLESSFRRLACLIALNFAIVSAALGGTCGDYLQTNHPKETDVAPAHESSFSLGNPPAPCRGPKCSESNKSDIPSPPAPVHIRPSQKMLSLSQVIFERNEPHWSECSVGDSTYALILTSGIFHPPRGA